eukprot:tig00001368_g8415.t1
MEDLGVHGADAPCSSPRPRVIIHIDLDCFYAQVEIARRPELRDKPVGVRQKFLIVTSNYVARGMGVKKMSSVAAALQQCPQLVVLDGEDLTPYRLANARICELFARFTPRLERLGLDEVFLDVSEEAAARQATGAHSWLFAGHVVGDPLDGAGGLRPEAVPLLVGSQIAREIREAMRSELGFTASAGISVSKTAAKLVGKEHKPDDQTTLLAGAIEGYIAPLEARRIPGIGHKTAAGLQAMGIHTVAELRGAEGAELAERFGERAAVFLRERARGVDSDEVRGLAPPKTISEEDALKGVESEAEVARVVAYLSDALAERLAADAAEHSRAPPPSPPMRCAALSGGSGAGRRRRATTLRVSWRVAGEVWARVSRQAPMPLEAVAGGEAGARAGAIARAAMGLFRRHLRAPFCLRLINLAATAFEPEGPAPAAPITSFFSRAVPRPAPPSPPSPTPKRPRPAPDGEPIPAPAQAPSPSEPAPASPLTSPDLDPPSLGEPPPRVPPEPPAPAAGARETAPADEEEDDDLVCLGSGPLREAGPEGGGPGGGVPEEGHAQVYVCGRCGAAVGGGGRGRMEHEDHHLALDLQRQAEAAPHPAPPPAPPAPPPPPPAAGTLLSFFERKK